MAQTFLERVTALAGTPASNTSLSTWLTDEARKIVDMMPFDELEKFSVNIQIDPAGTDIHEYRFVVASRNGYMARVLPYAEVGRINDTQSFWYPGVKDPVVVFNNQMVYGYPTADTGFNAQCVLYPTVSYDDTAISTIPLKYEELVTVGAAVQVLATKLETLRNSLPSVTSVQASVASNLALMVTYITTDEDFEKAASMGQEIQLELAQYLNTIQGARIHIEMATVELQNLRARYNELYQLFFGKGQANAAG